MYGVPKFRENFFMKYKKEVLLSVGALLTIITVVKVVPKDSQSEEQAMHTAGLTIENQQEQEPIGYEVSYKGMSVGIVESQEDVEPLIEAAYDELKKSIGYDPELTPETDVEPVFSGVLTADTNTIIEGLQSEMLANLDVIKEEAYVMRIGDDFTIALKSEDDIKEVLSEAQEYFLNSDVNVEVSLDSNNYNSLVLTPKVLMREKSTEPTQMLTAAPATETDAEEVNAKEAVAQQDVEEGIVDASGDQTEAGEMPEETETNVSQDTEESTGGRVMEVGLAEDVAIVKTHVNPSDIMDIKAAVEAITKENEKETMYTVQSGDSPSKIASDNDMGLSDLYDMNPGLKAKEKSLQIGEQVVVTVPEPELKVESKEEIQYTESIERGTSYVNDPDTYVGSNKVVSSGSDGVKTITAVITKLNGKEIGREITQTEITQEPVDKVISKGTKAFPVKGATGSFSYPVSGFYISSPFGYRHGSLHHGVDLAVPYGTAIHAADGGTVIFSGWKSSVYGYFVEIDHGDGVTTRYAHASKLEVSVGQRVAKGQEIAKVGSTGRSTGPHLHFEIRFNGVATNPLNYLE